MWLFTLGGLNLRAGGGRGANFISRAKIEKQTPVEFTNPNPGMQNGTKLP